jgi:hypothetical protein
MVKACFFWNHKKCVSHCFDVLALTHGGFLLWELINRFSPNCRIQHTIIVPDKNYKRNYKAVFYRFFFLKIRVENCKFYVRLDLLPEVVIAMFVGVKE